MKPVLITSSILILLIAALRPVLRGRIDPRVQYALWLTAALRLLVPGNLATSAYSALALLDRAEEQTQLAESIGRTSVPIVPVQSYEAAYDLAVQEYQRNRPVITDVASLTGDEEALLEARARELQARGPTLAQLAASCARPVWLTGAAVMGLWFLLVNLRLRRMLRFALPVEADCPLPVFVTPELPSPCLNGVLRPAVYVTPAALADPDRLRHVLAHELTHYRHRDHWWAWVRCVCLCLYWFDPLVWWAAALSRQDCELACDESAIRRLGEAERIPYGRTLVAMIAAGRNPLLQTATTMTGGKRRVQERIKLIARRPKTVLAVALALAALVTCAVGCTFTGAPENGSTPSPDPEPASSPSVDADDVLIQNLSFFYDDYSGVVMEGLEDSHAEWHADTSPSKGWLYFTDPTFCCPALEGKQVEGSALWADESRTTLGAVMNVNDERVVSGTVIGFYIHFTVELETGTVLTRDFASEIEGETLELDDQEMVGMARTLAKLLTAAEDYYLDSALAAADNARQSIQTVVNRMLIAPSVEYSLAPAGSSRIYVYPVENYPSNPPNLPANQYLLDMTNDFSWEAAPYSTSDGSTFLRVSASDGSASLSLSEGSYLVVDGDGNCWKGTYKHDGFIVSKDSTPFEYLRRFLFDVVELAALRPGPIPEEGQNHEDIARTWAENWEGSMTKVVPGSIFACTYVRVENVKADCHAWMEKDDLDEYARSRGFTGDDYGKIWFTFCYDTVFVPEKADNPDLWAGNTWYYEGDDAPEGALIYSRVAHMVLTDDGWTCEGTGTGW